MSNKYHFFSLTTAQNERKYDNDRFQLVKKYHIFPKQCIGYLTKMLCAPALNVPFVNAVDVPFFQYFAA